MGLLILRSIVAESSLTGLDWDGTAPGRRMLYWGTPFAIYDATYLFKVFQRDQVSNRADGNRYCTTFFWGNNGAFAWDGGSANTYYGAHPYPALGVGPPGGDLAWEISVAANDFVVKQDDVDPPPEVVYNQWYSQAFVASRESASLTHHKFYLALPSVATNATISHDVNDVGWADANPPSPAIVVGQAPDNGQGVSWGGYPGWEEQNAIIRGLQIYSAALTEAQIVARAALDTDAEVLALNTADGITSLWYLNMNPTPDDVTDKSGEGNNPAWEGAERPALYTA